MGEVTTIGLDLAKHVFQVHGVDAEGATVLRKQLRRAQVLAFFSRLPRCLVGLEACATAHYWALELLSELLPGATRIAVLVNPNNPGLTRDNIQQSEAAVRRLGLEMIVLKAGTESEIESAIVAAVQQQANALSIATDAYLNSRSRQIASFALRHALPTTGESRETVAAGLLMSHGPSQADSFRQAGIYVGRILKGEKPADLPVLQPTKIELVINITTAKAIGLKIPESFLLRADEVIE